MSSQSLPQFVAFRKAVKGGSKYSGELSLSALYRLVERTSDECQSDMVGDLASLRVKTIFAEDEFGKATINIQIDGVLVLRCERCLGQYSHGVAIENCLTVVRHDEEAKSRLGEVEPLVVIDDKVDMHRLIEDELLLALPIVPSHDLEQFPECAESALSGVSGKWLTLSSSGESSKNVSAEDERSKNVDAQIGGVYETDESERCKGNPFAVLSSMKLKH